VRELPVSESDRYQAEIRHFSSAVLNQPSHDSAGRDGAQYAGAGYDSRRCNPPPRRRMLPRRVIAQTVATRTHRMTPKLTMIICGFTAS
jgi:hypothetical protein